MARKSRRRSSSRKRYSRKRYSSRRRYSRRRYSRRRRSQHGGFGFSDKEKQWFRNKGQGISSAFRKFSTNVKDKYGQWQDKRALDKVVNAVAGLEERKAKTALQEANRLRRESLRSTLSSQSGGRRRSRRRGSRRRKSRSSRRRRSQH